MRCAPRAPEPLAPSNAPLPDALARIRAWGEARDWRGYDPYDALNSPLSVPLSLGTVLGRRLLTQAVKLSPFNLRPALGIRREWNAKALALVASGYARLAAAEGDDSAGRAAKRWLDWLEQRHGGGGAGMAWGYSFEVQTRVFRYARETPNTIATSFAAHAFMDAWELLGDARREAPVRAAVRFLVERMRRERGGEAYFAYLPDRDELVHNANLLACAVLARAGRLTDDRSLVESAVAAVETSLAAQRPDGSWPYSDTPGHDWVDNFHTAYVLDSLAECARTLPETAQALGRGVDYWETELFLPDGTPKYFPDRLLPVDAHCYATAIDTWLALADHRADVLERAERQARLLVDRMLDESGYVHFQRRRLWTSRVPYVRWSTAPSFRALAGLLLARSEAAASPRGGGHSARLA
jgi:hypothetical protein